MEDSIQRIERAIAHIKKMAESARDEKQKASIHSSLRNAEQALANCREVQRLLAGGEAS
jgi:hypothetical protein